MKAPEVITKLKGNTWLMPVSLSLFPFIRKMRTPPVSTMETELTIRIPTDQLTRYKRPKPQRRRFDVVSLVQPHYAAWGSECFTVGFEIKVSKSDLRGDKKMLEYIGYTDLFFIVVPEKLVDEALEVALKSEFIGVIAVGDSCKVVKMPPRQVVPDGHRAEVLQEMIQKQLKNGEGSSSSTTIQEEDTIRDIAFDIEFIKEITEDLEVFGYVPNGKAQTMLKNWLTELMGYKLDKKEGE